MTYCTHFYAECPDTAMEIEIEITFTCDEEEEKEMFWGFPVPIPASNEIEIVEVFKNNEEWLEYPDSITNKLHDNEWTPCTDIQRDLHSILILKLKNYDHAKDD